MPKFIVYERYYKIYEIEAADFEEAKDKVYCDEGHSGEFLFDDLAYITREDGHEQIYS